MCLFLRNFWELHQLTLIYTTFVYIFTTSVAFEDVNTWNCSHTQPFLEVMWCLKNFRINLPKNFIWVDWNQSCVGLTSH